MASRIGQRRFRATIIEIDKTTKDSGNNSVVTPVDRGKKWTSIKSVRGNEYLLGNQVHAETTHVLNMHNDEITRKITAEWLIKVKTRTFQVIEAPDYDFRERPDVTLGCKELVGGT